MRQKLPISKFLDCSTERITIKHYILCAFDLLVITLISISNNTEKEQSTYCKGVCLLLILLQL